MVDETQEDMELDRDIQELGKLVMAQEYQPAMINQSKVDEVELAFKILKSIVTGTNLKFTKKIFEPFKSVGGIVIEGNNIRINNPELFNKVAGLATNTEIYPLISNKLRIGFAFHGLMSLV